MKKSSLKNYLIVVLLACAALCVSCSSSQYKDMPASLPDLNTKADGSYRGEADFTGTPIKVILEADVRNHRITSINIIKHSSSPIGKKAEKIVDRIIEKQSLNVDVISGATVSSNAIRKAVENALQ